jgi:hypothetical protein
LLLKKKKPAGSVSGGLRNALVPENCLVDHEAHTPPDARIRCLRIRDVVAMVVVRPNITGAV